MPFAEACASEAHELIGGGVSTTQTPGCSYQEARGFWESRWATLDAGSDADLKSFLDTMVDCRRRSGGPDFVAFGKALAKRAEDELELRHVDKAGLLANAAHQVAPHRVSPFVALAKTAWANSFYFESASHLFRAVEVILNEPPFVWATCANFAFASLVGLIACLVACGMASLFRYFRPLTHDLLHRAPGDLPGWGRAAICGLIFGWPLFLRLGPLPTGLWWLVLTAPYLRTRERWARGVTLGTLTLLVAFLPLVTRSIAFENSRRHEFYRVLRDANSRASAVQLAGRIHLDGAELWALGLAARQQGNLKGARALFVQAGEQGIEHSSLEISRGNLDFALGRFAESIAHYDQAIARNPEELLPYFNKSQVLFSAVSDPEGAARAREQATQLDLEAVRALEEQAHQLGLTVVEPPVPHALLAAAMKQSPSDEILHRSALAELWRLTSGPLSRLCVLGLLALAGFYALGVAPFIAKYFSTDCRRCGSALCPVCKKRTEASIVCGGCRLPVGVVTAEARAMRIAKEIESHRYFAYRRQVAILSTALLPGAGQMIRGEPLSGSLLVHGFTFFLSLLYVHTSLMCEIAPDYAGLGSAAVAIVSTGLVLVYLAGWLLLLREEA